VIPFGRTNSSNISLLTRSSSSAAFEAMQEDEDEVVSFVHKSSDSPVTISPPGTDTSSGPAGNMPSPGLARTASGSPGLARTASGGIAPYRPGSGHDIDDGLLDELRGVLDINLPGGGGPLQLSTGKDELRVESEESKEERRGRSQRPKTLYWQKKTYGAGNWITRGTESPTRDLSPQRGGYELIERSVSPVRPPRGW